MSVTSTVRADQHERRDLLLAQGFGRVQVVAMALPVPGAIAAIYAIVLGAGNTSKVGFSWIALIFFALVCLAAAATSAARTVSSSRQRPAAD